MGLPAHSSRMARRRLARRREPYLWWLGRSPNPEGDESAYVGEAHTPHMPASFLAVASFSSLPGPGAAPARRRRQEVGVSWLVVPRSRNIINSSGPPGPLNPWRALGPSRSAMKKPRSLGGIRIYGGWGKAPTTIYTVLFSGQGAFSSPC